MNPLQVRRRGQSVILGAGTATIVACLLAALAFAPHLLQSNVETADASALRSEMFALHLSIDEARAAGRAFTPGVLSSGHDLETRSQLLLERIGVILAYPGVRNTLPSHASSLDLMQSMLGRRFEILKLAELNAPDPDSAPQGIRDQSLTLLAHMLNEDGVTFDRYVINSFFQLGGTVAYVRTRMEELSLWAQRFAVVVLLLGLLTVATLWLQRRELNKTGLTLRSAEHDLAEAHRIAHIGTVRWDYRNDEVTWSDELARIYGLQPGGRMTGTAFQALLVPGDVGRVGASETDALKRSQNSGRPELREITYRAYRSDGEVIELAALSELLADAAGGAVLMISTVRDITEEARAKRELHYSERSLSAAQRIASFGSFRRNIKTGQVHWSKEMFRLLGLTLEAGEMPLNSIVFGEDLPRIEAKLANLLAPSAPYNQRRATIDCRMRHARGGIRYMRGVAEMSYDEDGLADLLTGSLRDVTAEIAQESAMSEALAEAERANTAKSEFLAIMSHELRTPMNGVLGMLGAMDEASLPHEQSENLRVARSSANSLLVILNDILDISKIEAGKMELETAPFELQPLVRSVIHLYAQRAREKGIILDSTIGAGVAPWLSGDPGRIRQILVNLVSNAVKFTATGSVIVSVFKPSDPVEGSDCLRFCVTDTGIGIPLETQPQVFGRFNQLDASYTRRFGGTGLGLSICRSLAELMAGYMTFESRPNEGSMFCLDLSLAPAEAGAETPIIDFEAALPRMRILVAEDNSTNQIVARSMLERLGQNADFVLNGQEAIEAVQRFHYDLILMDVSMPVVDGLEATRQIRKLEGPRGQVPVVGLTAHVGYAELKACLDAGFNEVLTKPLLMPVLQAALSRWQGDAGPRETIVLFAAGKTSTSKGVIPGSSTEISQIEPRVKLVPATAKPEANLAGFGDSAVMAVHLRQLCQVLGEDEMPGLLQAGIIDLDQHNDVIVAFQRDGSGTRFQIERSFHSLVGVAETLGCKEFANLARQLETTAATLPHNHEVLLQMIAQIVLMRRELTGHLLHIQKTPQSNCHEECL